MFDIGWSEMAIIMLLALIIIGPKDLPRVARTIGQWVRKGRMLAREFQTSLEEMARESELDDVKKEIEKIGRTDLKKAVENSIDPKGELSKAFDTADTETPADGKAAAGKSSDTTNADAATRHLNGAAASDGKTAEKAVTGPGSQVSSSGQAGVAVPVKVETPPAEKGAAPKRAAARKPSTAKAKSKPKAAASPAKTTTSAAKKATPRARVGSKPAASAKTRTTKAAGRAASTKAGADKVVKADNNGGGAVADKSS